MLRWWRRKMRLVRYYAASPDRTVWTRAGDVALIVAFVMAFPAAWLADRTSARPAPGIAFAGTLVEHDGRWRAILYDEAAAPELPRGYRGSFSLELRRQHRGLPLVSTTATLPPRVVINEPGGRTRVNEGLGPEDPERLAIEAAIRESDSVAAEVAIERWREAEPGLDRHPLAWIMNAGLWWIVLFVLASAGLLLTRFVVILVTGNRAARRAMLEAQGRCASCGYDLRGLEFNERCPECGDLIY